MKLGYRTFLIAAIFAAVTGAGCHKWSSIATTGSFERLASGDGRLEAAEITVTSVVAGRLGAVLVHEGQVVRAGQVLARVEVESLIAEHREALARHREALYAQALAKAEVVFSEREVRSAEAAVRDSDREFDAVIRQLAQALSLAREAGTSPQALEDHRAAARRIAADASAAEARLATTAAAASVARLRSASAKAAVAAADATIRRVLTQVAEGELKAPCDGMVLSPVARTGDVLYAGERVLGLVDLAGLSMTFLVPEAVARQIASGTEARIVLETEPRSVVPATISLVNAAAANDLPQGMRRLQARLDRDPVGPHAAQLTPGLAGVIWVKLDPQLAWPPALALTPVP